MANPNDLTRQQLDELDALLQRMLAGPAAPEVPPAPTGWRADTPAAVPEPPAPHLTPTFYEVPEPELAPVANPFAYAVAEEPPPRFTAPAPAPQPVPMTPYSSGLLPSFERDEEAALYAPIPLSPLRPAIEPAAPLAVVEPAPAAGLHPLAVPSACIEWVLNLFGPPGQMLTTPAGKNLLGVTGIVLLAGAAAYYCHGIGLVRVPYLP
jgi:hypothetical protein